MLFISCTYSGGASLALGIEDPESPAHVLCALQTTVCSSAITFMPWSHHDSLFLVAQLSLSFGARCDSFPFSSLGRQIGSRPGFNLAGLEPRSVFCGITFLSCDGNILHESWPSWALASGHTAPALGATPFPTGAAWSVKVERAPSGPCHGYKACTVCMHVHSRCWRASSCDIPALPTADYRRHGPLCSPCMKLGLLVIVLHHVLAT